MLMGILTQSYDKMYGDVVTKLLTFLYTIVIQAELAFLFSIFAIFTQCNQD